MKIIDPSFKILKISQYEDAVHNIEKITRTSYKSAGRIKDDISSSENFIRGRIQQGHESVIEHESITVGITCDRGVSHEFVRHRIASYTQESTRYCNYSLGKFDSSITVIRPVIIGVPREEIEKEHWYTEWKKSCEFAEARYLSMIAAGAHTDEARGVLPHSLKVDLVMTMNLREWRHFFRLRCAGDAHHQARYIACMLLHEFITKMPVFFEDLKYLDPFRNN